MEDYTAAHSGRGPSGGGPDGEKEDLFMNIAADDGLKQRPVDTSTRVDRLKVSHLPS
jgi:hypothetical protein